MFREASSEVSINKVEELKWLMPRNPKTLRDAMGAKGRDLMISALAVTVIDGDRDAVEDILNFSKERRILLNIDEFTINTLVDQKDYEMMRMCIASYVYFRVRLIKTNAS